MSYQQRRKEMVEMEVNNLRDIAVKSDKQDFYENQSEEFRKWKNKSDRWAIEQLEGASKEEIQKYKDLVWERWGCAAEKMMPKERERFVKHGALALYKLLNKCPYTESTWYADNFDKGSDWMQEHANERPEIYYKDGYCKMKKGKLSFGDVRAVFGTFNKAGE